MVKDVFVQSNIDVELKSPILQGQVLGNIKIVLGEDIIFSSDILAKEEIKKKDVKDYFFNLLSFFLLSHKDMV